LTEIASAAGQAFEEILKLRRRSGPSPTPRPDGSTADSLPARPGESWGPAPERIRAAYGGDQDGEDIEPAAIEPPARSRATTADEEHGPGGPPPATLVPETPPLPPSPWRLSPQLAAQALDERAAAETSAPSDAPPTDDEADSADPPPETPETPASGHDEITQIGPAPTAGTAGAASHDSAESAAEATVDAQPDDDPSAHATNEYPAISHSDDDGNIKFRKTQKLLAMGVADPDADSLSRDTVHSAPPPPPLPPPPPSAVEDPSDGQTRHPRSPTIHGLPPPEPRSHPSASGSFRAPVPNLGDDDDDEVTIISLAQPIMPATARGRIELEDEDWMPPDSPLAADSQHEEIDTLIDAVVSGEASPDQLREHGNAAMLRLMAQFPGPLEVLRRDLHSLPPPSAHGPLIRTVIALGATVVPHVIDLFEHPNPDVRFYAAFVFHELRDPRCMRPLAQLGFDDNGDVRVVTMRVLETYRRSEGFEAAATVVRNQLADSSRADQLHAARAAGTLRDIGSIPQLVDQLSGGDRFIQEAALESLCSITGQQHGLKPHRWRAWYEAQGHRHRIEWIIDSLRHRDVPVRRWAADELVRITGHRVPFSPMGDRRAREVAAKAWTTWWDDRGRAMFGG
ncbi:MAG: hypothetical protein K0V04_17070, partial [Deltaproteobacteria bacterium]|nr:hypothetical protein [Deltaproteobacteria bacterium]